MRRHGKLRGAGATRVRMFEGSRAGRSTWTASATAYAALAALAVACSGGTPPPDSPDDPPPLDDTSSETPREGAAPASSEKVQAGMDAIQAGDFESAKSALTEAVAETPDDPQAHFYLGVATHALGDAEGSIAHYEKALELDPKLAEARMNLSAALLDAGQTDEALAIIDEALGADPNNAALLLNKGIALSQKGDATGATEALGKAAAASPDDPEVRYLYAEALAQSGKKGQAVKELSKLTSSDKPEVLASSARLLGRLEAFDQCIAALDKAIGMKDEAELYVQRGLCKHGKKDEKAALADYEASVAKNPEFAAGYFYLGQHKRARGDKKGAKAALTKAAELDPQGGIGKAAKKALKAL